MIEGETDGRVDARERVALQNLWITIDVLFLALLLLLFVLLDRFAFNVGALLAVGE